MLNIAFYNLGEYYVLCLKGDTPYDQLHLFWLNTQIKRLHKKNGWYEKLSL